MTKARHYNPCAFAYDTSWPARAARAGSLDGFHGYPEQDNAGIRDDEIAAYTAAYNKAKLGDLAGNWKSKEAQ